MLSQIMLTPKMFWKVNKHILSKMLVNVTKLCNKINWHMMQLRHIHDMQMFYLSF